MKKDAQRASQEFMEHIWEVLKDHGKIRLHGLGTFEIKQIPGRETYNPSTKGKTYMEPYLKIKFRPSAGLQRHINNG